MKIDALPFPEKIINIFKNEINELNPPQIDAIKKGVLDGKNLVVSSPTASGKTFIAELAFIKNFLKNGKTVYLVPLKALASEKYVEFKEKYEKIGMRVALSIGDLDSSDPWLDNYDLIVVSNEKMDSLLRHNAKWIKDITLVIADEIHLLNDHSRGPTLEIVLTRLKEHAKQIIALSATIKNSKEIAEWLDANLVESNYRPIKLYKGVSYQEKNNYIVEFLDKENLNFKNSDESSLIEDTLRRGKQALIFVSTRKSAEATAEKINIREFLNEDEKNKLNEISEEIKNALNYPTRQCKKLAKVVKNGVAFHHAGLVAKQRQIIENNFRNGLIKFIVATPTLAFGINMPAWRVLIRDAKRYDNKYGSIYIPTLEIQQMMGRSGRPKYDTDGEAILISKSKNDANDLKERYIFGDPEPIYSKLSMEMVLRMHILALISTEVCKTRKDLIDFFSKTFFAYQYGDMKDVMNKIEKILSELANYKFIKFGGDETFISTEFTPAFNLTGDIKISATKIGKRVSELYIDPVSANTLIRNFIPMKDIEYLMVLNECIEMWPLLNVKKSDDYLENEIVKHGIKNIPDVWDYEYDEFISRFKTALMFFDWMNEIGEDKMLDKYGITPGELYNKITNAEWLLYAASEIAILINKKDIANRFNKLRLRIKYGVKEELLKLIKIKGIGRVRARLLYNSGIKNPFDIKNVSIEKLEKILGPKTAKNIKEFLNEELEDKLRRIKKRK
ncbi:MAG: DEAD/DEAH box helicase [Candidatus Aenigmatarchaeota archaeon]